VFPLPRASESHQRSYDPDRDFADASWDFADSIGAASLHPYPARFIPDIPRQALKILDVDGPVLDPFCGSGTTLIEARRAGLPAVGVDLNPVACLISRVRNHTWHRSHAKIGMEHARLLSEHALSGQDRGDVGAKIPRLEHWFDEWASDVLAGAMGYLQQIGDPIWHDRVAVAISSTIVRISRQDSDTRYAAIEKRGDAEWAAAELARGMIRVCDWLSKHGVDGPPATVYCGDARDLSQLGDQAFSACVFSPPYPNAYEYWLYHKYRMYWLGFDPISVRESELGARPHYSKKNGLTEEDFASQMSDVFVHLERVLKRMSPMVVVVGDSVIGGRHIDNGELIISTATEHGFDIRARTKRKIRPNRSSFNRSHSRARRHEHVLLLRRR
jgi:DNA modification methylase